MRVLRSVNPILKPRSPIFGLPKRQFPIYMTILVDYNTERPKLIISEYGRNVQKMVEHCMTVEDRTERTQMAQAIIQVIGQLNPALRKSEDGDHTLWDHMYIMSDFKLDVDGPFPMPKPEDLMTKPNRVAYPQNRSRGGHYGKIVEKLIEKAMKMEQGEDRDAFTLAIANLMKRNFISHNQDNVRNDVIIKDLGQMSGDMLVLKDPEAIADARDLATIAKPQPTQFKRGGKKKGGGGKGRSGRGNSNHKRRR